MRATEKLQYYWSLSNHTCKEQGIASNHLKVLFPPFFLYSDVRYMSTKT